MFPDLFGQFTVDAFLESELCRHCQCIQIEQRKFYHPVSFNLVSLHLSNHFVYSHDPYLFQKYKYNSFKPSVLNNILEMTKFFMISDPNELKLTFFFQLLSL